MAGKAGRPKVGGRICIRLGPLLPALKTYATQHNTSDAEAARLLIAAGLQVTSSDDPAVAGKP